MADGNGVVVADASLAMVTPDGEERLSYEDRAIEQGLPPRVAERPGHATLRRDLGAGAGARTVRAPRRYAQPIASQCTPRALFARGQCRARAHRAP